MTKQETKELDMRMKIRKNLRDNYHLSERYDEEFEWHWVLYDADMPTFEYFSDENKPIMTSEDSSLEDLYKFSEEHKSYSVSDVFRIITRIGLFAAIINFGVIFTNIEYLKGMTLGAMLISFLFELILFNVDNTNFTNGMKRVQERIQRREENEKQDRHNI